MAHQVFPFQLTKIRATPNGLQCSSIIFSVPSIPCSSLSAIQSSHKMSSPNHCTRLKIPTHTGLNSSFCAPNRQLKVLKIDRMERCLVSSGMAQGLGIMALQGSGSAPRRLVDVLRAIPKISKAYFKSPFRRALYGGIALLGGFYVAQTISLSFGALGVNDVIAAALCVLLAEYVTKFYHTRTKVTFTIALLNNFKMGFTYGLFIDAFKLAS